MSARRLEAVLAAVRVGMGATLLLAPRRGARMWIGRDASRQTAPAISRWLGVRDIALGLTLARLLSGSPRRSQIFLEATLVDVADAATAFLMRERLPGSGWPLIAAGAGVMAVVDGALALTALREERARPAQR